MNRRQIDFRDFESVKVDVQQLHEKGYEKIGDWDLTQICHHLTMTMDRSMNGFPFQAPWLVRKLIIPFIKKKIYGKRTMKTGMKAPPDMVVSPGQGEDEIKAVEQFNQMVDQIEQCHNQFATHPFFGQVTDEEWRQFHLIHSSHHLSFVTPRPSQTPS